MIVFVDEAGFYLLPAVVRTYAPCGCTPVLRVFQTRDHLSAMSGITMNGYLFTRVKDDAMNGADAVGFLKHLLSQLDSLLLVIWDGSPIHRGEAVKTFLSNGGGERVHLERLPPYAPELNPDESVWNHLKNVELANVCCVDFSQLHHELSLAILRLRRRTDLIQSFFITAGLAL
jgi:transposase